MDGPEELKYTYGMWTILHRLSFSSVTRSIPLKEPRALSAAEYKVEEAVFTDEGRVREIYNRHGARLVCATVPRFFPGLYPLPFGRFSCRPVCWASLTFW